jgi:FKBP-type peptidyl-prolyl cis-trans isomerase FkpA
MKMIKISLVVLFSALIFSACNKTEKTHKENIAEIKKYLADNNLTAQETESGLHYIVTKEGDGSFPTVENRVTVNYKGYLTDNATFDQGQNVQFPLSGVIKGWQEGIPKFSRGGSGILLIPSDLGYGANGSGPIPGGAVLIFDVDLINFQ